MVPQETQLAFEYTVLEMATMGRYPHLGAFEIEGPDDLEIAREALRATGTDHLAVAVVQHAVRRRKTARRHCRRAGAESRHSVCSTNRRPRSISRISSRSARFFSKLNRERDLTIVVSTHDLNFAASLCRELVLLHQGRVLAAGPTETMLEADAHSASCTASTSTSRRTREPGQLTVIPVARAVESPQP